MTAIARALSRALPAVQYPSETLKTLIMFALVGLTVTLLVASYGIDLSPGLF